MSDQAETQTETQTETIDMFGGDFVRIGDHVIAAGRGGKVKRISPNGRMQIEHYSEDGPVLRWYEKGQIGAVDGKPVEDDSPTPDGEDAQEQPEAAQDSSPAAERESPEADGAQPTEGAQKDDSDHPLTRLMDEVEALREENARLKHQHAEAKTTAALRLDQIEDLQRKFTELNRVALESLKARNSLDAENARLKAQLGVQAAVAMTTVFDTLAQEFRTPEQISRANQELNTRLRDGWRVYQITTCRSVAAGSVDVVRYVTLTREEPVNPPAPRAATVTASAPEGVTYILPEDEDELEPIVAAGWEKYPITAALMRDGSDAVREFMDVEVMAAARSAFDAVRSAPTPRRALTLIPGRAG